MTESVHQDPIHQFAITPIIELNVGGMDLSFTNSSLWMVIGVLFSTITLSVAMQRKALIPGRMQSVAEILYEFVAGMIRENIGPEGRKYFPLVFTLFTIVLMGNMLGLLPYSFTYTSHIIVTGALAVMVFLAIMVIGIFRHGLKFFSLFCPAGVPLWLMPLIIPLEILSFVMRPITLSVRLFANMMAGHLMLKVIAGFSVTMAGAGMFGLAASLAPMLFNVVLIAFETLIAFLHAYVFAILSCVYLKDTVEIHH